ncbi:hypothetical protein EJB05_33828, partial [Eragrostis curvula]
MQWAGETREGEEAIFTETFSMEPSTPKHVRKRKNYVSGRTARPAAARKLWPASSASASASNDTANHQELAHPVQIEQDCNGGEDIYYDEHPDAPPEMTNSKLCWETYRQQVDFVNGLSTREEETLDRINSGPADEVVVQIEDVQLTKKMLEFFATPELYADTYVSDEVIEAWKRMFRRQNISDTRDDGKVLLDSTAKIQFFRTIGSGENDTLLNYGIEYLQHDMVFLPMKRGAHWYLAVINSRKHKIQVLDTNRKQNLDYSDLKNILMIIEECLELAGKEGHSNGWPDFKVASWDVERVQNIPRQTDRSSYGLFLIIYLQFWTGEKMSETFTKDNINMFRWKLGPSLIWSPLNMIH